MNNNIDYSTIKSVVPGSCASKTIIAPGDVLRKINGIPVRDVLDYKFLSYDGQLLLELASEYGGEIGRAAGRQISALRSRCPASCSAGAAKHGKVKLVRLSKAEGEDPGLEFESFLMDRQRSCANKCIFCFIDQLPEGMRETLYYKDDDVRLSFFQGNYVTLTNLSRRDIERIIALRVSPINISVHTLDPELRAFMLGIKNGSAGVETIKALANAGIIMNCQIVCCPGINDGAELTRTMRGLIELGPFINSVSVVPVGLTKHRQGLTPLRPFDRKLALETVRQVEAFAGRALRRRGSRVFFCADEMYIKAGLKLPPHRYYEAYPQLENGVGMMRLFITEFFEELGVRSGQFGTGKGNREARISWPKDCEPFSVVTGETAGKYLTNLLMTAAELCAKIRFKVFVIKNDFFGREVTVSGLITGGDIIARLKGCDCGSRLLVPINMLRNGEDVFLDDVTVADVSQALGIPVRVVKHDGADFLRAIFGE